MRLYVGNLSYRVTESDLRALFGTYGEVSSARVVVDRESGRPMGFAFVELSSGADAAVGALNQTEFMGRNLVVSASRERSGRSAKDRDWDWRS